MPKYKTLNKKKFLLLALLAGLLLIGGALAYTNRNNNLPVVVVTTPEGPERIDLNPPTEEEKKETADNKDAIANDQQNGNTPTTTTPGQKKSVKPTITNTTGSINAYVAGIFEEGGTCTATFTKGTSSRTKTSAGFQNASYTQCAPISLEPGFLSPGDWTVSLKYTSEKSEGTSDTQVLKVT